MDWTLRSAWSIDPAMPSRDEVTIVEVSPEGPFDTERAHRAGILVHNASGSRLPLAMIRSWSRSGEYVRDLARHLGSDQPVYSIAPPDFEDPRDYPEDTAQWVDFFVQRFEDLPVPGPIVLSGWSWGGVVALELAERLANKGEEIRGVLLLDVRIPDQRPYLKPVKGHAFKRGFLHVDRFVAELRSIERPRKRWKFVKKKLFPEYYQRKKEAKVAQMREAGVLSAGPERREFDAAESLARAGFVDTSSGERMSALKRAVQVSYVKYERHPTSLPIAIFWTRHAYDRRKSDPTLGWGPLLEGPHRCIEIAGDHYSMFDPPNDEELAAQMGEILEDIALARF